VQLKTTKVKESNYLASLAKPISKTTTYYS